jgi:hypothetical protein
MDFIKQGLVGAEKRFGNEGIRFFQKNANVY